MSAVQTAPTPQTLTDHAARDAQIAAFRQAFGELRAELARVIVGQEEIVELTLMAMVAGGHVLLEGVPGLGKTLLVKSIAQAFDLTFKRVQFTPDLMPADIIGTKMLLDDGHGHTRFEFAPGPVFCHLLLADEINRATPKTQSALLEAMQERSVTIAGETHRLGPPYFVLATQNPIEQEGTYPLPEAQLDRFTFKVTVGYPSVAEFSTILDRTTGGQNSSIRRVCGGPELIAWGALAREVPVAETVKQRAVELVMATHPETPFAPPVVKKYVRFGASPRAGQAMLLTAKIRALLAGRFHVGTEDLLAVALPVLNHRLILNFEAQADGRTAEAIVREVMATKQAAWAKA